MKGEEEEKRRGGEGCRGERQRQRKEEEEVVEIGGVSLFKGTGYCSPCPQAQVCCWGDAVMRSARSPKGRGQLCKDAIIPSLLKHHHLEIRIQARARTERVFHFQTTASAWLRSEMWSPDKSIP